MTQPLVETEYAKTKARREQRERREAKTKAAAPQRHGDRHPETRRFVPKTSLRKARP
jgi:hypothetical protein